MYDFLQATTVSLAAVQQQVATIVREILGTDVDAEQPLMAAGLDSLGKARTAPNEK